MTSSNDEPVLQQIRMMPFRPGRYKGGLLMLRGGGKCSRSRVHLSESTLRSLLTNQILPSYPVDAQSKAIQGKVVLKIHIEKDGRVSSVATVSGDSLLAQSAMDAAKRP